MKKKGRMTMKSSNFRAGRLLQKVRKSFVPKLPREVILVAKFPFKHLLNDDARLSSQSESSKQFWGRCTKKLTRVCYSHVLP
ncbi:Cytosol aminopeptidase [Actinidia chinensis var. chinensis]|uniref:Cytosol aminopeptidase n=1 Tax=Actinidia chinensis var. chinensis TaxID=1590841 RepID=A0A2R6QPR4_ACTCC|nr:Cytosol aminopeptidase [Actinidia chinensis var. chinensis]